MQTPEIFGNNIQVDLYLFVEGQGQSHKVIIPRELLDDEVGDSSSVADRKMWIESNIEIIMDAVTAKTEGGTVRRPFDRIVVKDT